MKEANMPASKAYCFVLFCFTKWKKKNLPRGEHTFLK